MQTFDKLFLSEASDIAFAGEIVVIVSASSIPKLSNLFFIFLSPFVFVFFESFFVIFTFAFPCHSELVSESFTSSSQILKRVQDDGLVSNIFYSKTFFSFCFFVELLMSAQNFFLFFGGWIKPLHQHPPKNFLLQRS